MTEFKNKLVLYAKSGAKRICFNTKEYINVLNDDTFEIVSFEYRDAYFVLYETRCKKYAVSKYAAIKFGSNSVILDDAITKVIMLSINGEDK